MQQQELPLKGIRVIDYTHFLAGPYVSRCLAALGAEVIKVERPTTGDAARQHAYFIKGQSGYYLQQNIGKKGLCVNLKDPQGKGLMKKLIDSADVLVENYRPGTLEKFGLGYKDVSKTNKGIVYCSISAYGHTGPDSHRAGFGLIAEAKSGIMAMVGEPNQTPPLLRIALGDMYTGASALSAIMAALLGRVKSGVGQHIDLALYDCLVSMHEYAVQTYTLSGGTEIPYQTGYDIPSSTLLGAFTAKDGHLVIAAQVDDAWKRLAQIVGGKKLAEDTRFHSAASRNENRLLILPLVKKWVKKRTVAEVLETLDKVDVPSAKIQNIEEVLQDPQIQARNMLVEQNHPILGKIQMPNLPFNFSGFTIDQSQCAPLMGQHNAEIAAELGFTEEDIEAMHNNGVLYQENI
jgi:crotonobetainyl-CoA:carnitine CoA-transferase CaiB-like acyl-CoA transferase